MNTERKLLIESVLDGKLSPSVLSPTDLDDYQFMLDCQEFDLAVAEAYLENPALTFSGSDSEMLH